MNYQLACRVLLLTIMIPLISACGHDSTEKNNSRPAVRVKTMAVTNSGVEESCSYSGTVEEESGTLLSFSTAGTIKALSVSEGDKVKKGN